MVILFLGPLGALVYLLVEALPDLGLLRVLKVFPRRKRIRHARGSTPTLRQGTTKNSVICIWKTASWCRRVTAFDRAIGARAIPWTRSIAAESARCNWATRPRRCLTWSAWLRQRCRHYDFYRAAGLLAHAYAQTGQKERAETLFREVTAKSVASETYLNFADLLASEGHIEEARAWARKVLEKKPAMPGYLRRRERPWFRSANKLLKRLAT